MLGQEVIKSHLVSLGNTMRMSSEVVTHNKKKKENHKEEKRKEKRLLRQYFGLSDCMFMYVRPHL